ncbi:MAG: hypothetical protein AAF657_03785 [Acidobacteriota bacterium]
MKVLHVSDTELSSAPYRLAKVQRIAGLEAKLLSIPDRTSRAQYPHPDLFMTSGRAVLASHLDEADVVHYHNRWRDSLLFRLQPWAWPVLEHKPSVIQFHSPREGNGFEESLRETSLIKLVVAQYHPRIYPECRPVQNAIPIDEPLHQARDVRNEPPVIVYTPPHCDDAGWRNKGCGQTLPILEDGFRFRYATGRSWREIMALRQGCDIAIDEIVTGSYHMCSLEALSQGLATIAGLDSLTVDAIEQVTGTREHPWIVATPDTLRDVLTELCEDEGYRLAKRQQARAFVEKYWSPQVVTRRFRRIYDEALARS